MKPTFRYLWRFAGAFLITISSVSAQGIIDWFSLDAAAGNQSSASYQIRSTVGQVDIGQSSGGVYTIIAGFWALESSTGPTAPPALRIELVSGGVRLSWPSSTTGFSLEAADTLSGVWSGVGGTPDDDGLFKSIDLRPTEDERFFRLAK
jgi:hypothetical protein